MSTNLNINGSLRDMIEDITQSGFAPHLQPHESSTFFGTTADEAKKIIQSGFTDIKNDKSLIFFENDVDSGLECAYNHAKSSKSITSPAVVEANIKTDRFFDVDDKKNSEFVLAIYNAIAEKRMSRGDDCTLIPINNMVIAAIQQDDVLSSQIAAMRYKMRRRIMVPDPASLPGQVVVRKRPAIRVNDVGCLSALKVVLANE